MCSGTMTSAVEVPLTALVDCFFQLLCCPPLTRLQVTDHHKSTGLLRRGKHSRRVLACSHLVQLCYEQKKKGVAATFLNKNKYYSVYTRGGRKVHMNRKHVETFFFETAS